MSGLYSLVYHRLASNMVSPGTNGTRMGFWPDLNREPLFLGSPYIVSIVNARHPGRWTQGLHLTSPTLNVAQHACCYHRRGHTQNGELH
jgi:hypothetical protein